MALIVLRYMYVSLYQHMLHDYSSYKHLSHGAGTSTPAGLSQFILLCCSHSLATMHIIRAVFAHPNVYRYFRLAPSNVYDLLGVES